MIWNNSFKVVVSLLLVTAFTYFLGKIDKKYEKTERLVSQQIDPLTCGSSSNKKLNTSLTGAKQTIERSEIIN